MVKFFLAAGIIFFASLLHPQEQTDITVRKDELRSLRDEIKQLESEIAEKSRKEKKTFETLEKMKKQVFVLNVMINKIRLEESEKEKAIDRTSAEIEDLEARINALKENYARSITGLYKYGNPTNLDIFLNSASVNQALLRKEYLKRFSLQRQNDITTIDNDIKKLSSLRVLLESEKKDKELLAREKAGEQQRLKGKMSENSKMIAAIKKDKRELKKEIDGKKKAEIRIKNLIEKLIAEAERKRREEQKRLAELEKNRTGKEPITENASANFDLNTAGLKSFSALKGRLNWPVLNGKITGNFGENRNRLLNTVTLNYGIDIKTGKDLNVKSVADGIVSAIDWIPGYGSVIIITHSEDYRTVYSRLSEIYVSEGEKVQAGSLIAKVGESLEGSILHFEIWNSRNYQNPEIWLARK